MLETLKNLCLCAGVTGNEGKIADLITSLSTPYADECHVDKMGNVIVCKKGKSKEKKIAFVSRMDIAGYTVTHIEENGRIRFCAQGKQSAVSLAYSCVTFDNGVSGIALPDSTSSKEFKTEEMYIDVGCSKKEDAEKVVSLGATFTEKMHFTHLQDGKIASLALDCRIGCALLLQAIREDTTPCYDTYFIFCAQGNFAQRGARAAMFPINADIIISLDVSSSEREENKHLPPVLTGKGAAVLLKDALSVSNEALVGLLRGIAKGKGLPLQNEFSKTSSSDGSSMMACCDGCATCAITVPLSHRATGVQVASVSDIEGAYTLLSTLYKSNFAEITGETK